jgi:hypothetical protein
LWKSLVVFSEIFSVVRPVRVVVDVRVRGGVFVDVWQQATVGLRGGNVVADSSVGSSDWGESVCHSLCGGIAVAANVA